MLSAFLIKIRKDLEENGYSTPEIVQFLSGLEKITDNQEATSFVSRKISTLIDTSQNPLENLFVVTCLLNYFKFTTDVYYEIVLNNINLLKNYYYNKELALNDYDLNTRLEAWGILSYLYPTLNQEQQVEIKQLAELVSSLPEDNYIKEQFCSAVLSSRT